MGIATAIIGAVTAVAAATSAAITAKSAHDQRKAARRQEKAAKQAQEEMKKQVAKTPVYNEKKEIKNVANTEYAANKKRALMETDTIKTSALGNVDNNTQTTKKTLLGG